MQKNVKNANVKNPAKRLYIVTKVNESSSSCHEKSYPFTSVLEPSVKALFLSMYR